MGAATASLQDALEARPAWAGKPSTMIAEMAVSLARALDLPNGEVERVRTASLLHDLGKLAIPDEILTNPGELTDPEWRVVSEHPKIGHVVLEQAGALRDAATIVLHHHEWYDGRGYPHGLSGQEIPVGARIVAIADAYEAMVAGRPYRRAVNHEQAIAELRRHAGVQFDPEIVRLFSILFADGVPWRPDGHAFLMPIRIRATNVRTPRSTTTSTIAVGWPSRPQAPKSRSTAVASTLRPGRAADEDGPRPPSPAAARCARPDVPSRSSGGFPGPGCAVPSRTLACPSSACATRPSGTAGSSPATGRSIAGPTRNRRASGRCRATAPADAGAPAWVRRLGEPGGMPSDPPETLPTDPSTGSPSGAARRPRRRA